MLRKLIKRIIDWMWRKVDIAAEYEGTAPIRTVVGVGREGFIEEWPLYAVDEQLPEPAIKRIYK